MADSRLPALTEISTPALDDELYIVDISDTTDHASGTSRKITNQRLAGLLLPSICQGRITTESGVPVSNSDRSSQSTIYFTPHNGNRISLYDGTRWRLYAFTECSLALSSLTSAKNYDVFLYDNSGTLTLELSAAWTSATARNDALTTQDGIYVKSGATTRRYLGTIYTTGTTTTEDSRTKRFVWNAYNQVPRELLMRTSDSYWSYNSSTTRQANANSAHKVEATNGLVTYVEVNVSCVTDGNATNAGFVGVGFDTTTTFSTEVIGGGHDLNTGGRARTICQLRKWPDIGYHAYNWLEKINVAAAFNFFGDRGYGDTSGITGFIIG